MHIDTHGQSGLPQVVIGGRTFELAKWGAAEQTDTLFDLMGVLGETIGSVADLYLKNKDNPDEHISRDIIEKVLGRMSTGINRDKALSRRLFQKLSSGERVLCDGVKVLSFDAFYRDNLFLAFEVARANLEVQYGSFFAAVGSTLAPPRSAQSLAASGPTPTDGTGGP